MLAWTHIKRAVPFRYVADDIGALRAWWMQIAEQLLSQRSVTVFHAQHLYLTEIDALLASKPFSTYDSFSVQCNVVRAVTDDDAAQVRHRLAYDQRAADVLVR